MKAWSSDETSMWKDCCRLDPTPSSAVRYVGPWPLTHPGHSALCQSRSQIMRCARAGHKSHTLCQSRSQIMLYARAGHKSHTLCQSRSQIMLCAKAGHKSHALCPSRSQITHCARAGHKSHIVPEQVTNHTCSTVARLRRGVIGSKKVILKDYAFNVCQVLCYCCGRKTSSLHHCPMNFHNRSSFLHIIAFTRWADIYFDEGFSIHHHN